LFVDHGYPEVGPEKDFGSVEILWGNTNDGERMFIDIDRRSQDAWVAAELVTPERITQHDIGRRIRAVFIVEVEEPSQLRT